MSGKASCPKCRAGLLFEVADRKNGNGTVLHCYICGYEEATGNTKCHGKGKATKKSGLGEYMTNYPNVPSVAVKYVPSDSLTFIDRPLRTCVHNQVEVKMGVYTLWLSELPLSSWKRTDPDLGVYMAEPWLRFAGNVVTNGIQLRGHVVNYDMVYINWEDRGAVNIDELIPVVNLIIDYLEAGKQVELGCFGGHGRTGTVAACVLAVLEGLDGTTAIEELRKRYCVKAVEGKTQVEFVRSFVKAFTREPS